MSLSQTQTLYSFRRCPYAMRARMALLLNGVTVEIREIVLKNKPQSMLDCSPKGTVPVLVLEDGTVIDESRDIMDFSLRNSNTTAFREASAPEITLINTNDTVFKTHLDKYKYADRFPEFDQQDYRQQGEVFLQQLENMLNGQDFLFGDSVTYADIAIFPFIRQFAHVDKLWFDSAHYPNLKRWLDGFLQSRAFMNVMKKIPCWQSGDESTYFPFNET